MPLHNKPIRFLRFAQNIARWGIPRRSLLFGKLSLGDDLLCTAVLREARIRGKPFWMMTARSELFERNTDPAGLLPIDDDYVAGLRRLGVRIIQPYYVKSDPTNGQRDILPNRHVIAEMCALAGLSGKVDLRPYLFLSEEERFAGKLFPSQIAIQTSGLSARIPYETKEWITEGWVETARLLSPHTQLIQIGSPSDPAIPVSIDLRGKTSLRQAASILANSSVFLGPEGFLAHLARAVDCPSIIVMGGRAPEYVFGYAANHNITAHPSCSPCGLRSGCLHKMECMKAITPAQVTQFARSILLNPPARPLEHTSFVIP